MNKTEKIISKEKILKEIIDGYKKLSAAMDAAEAAGCMGADGPLFNAIWEWHDYSLSLIDGGGWISWYIYDNNCGANGYLATAGTGQRREIRTVKQLARLIVEWEDINS